MSQRIPKVRRKASTRIPPIRCRILLLDDHEGSRYVMRHALMSFGHDCKAVSSTRAALLAVETYGPEVIIYEWYTRTDERIGLSLRFRERTAPGVKALAIIVLSSADEPEGFRDREDIDAYLTKPMKPAELELVLRRATSGSADR
jgi:CheY-like chemotaxis protein